MTEILSVEYGYDTSLANISGWIGSFQSYKDLKITEGTTGSYSAILIR